MGRKSKAKQERRKKREQAKQAVLEAAKRAEEQAVAEPETRPSATEKTIAAEPEILPPFNGESDFEQQLQRILNILGVSNEADADVTAETLETYFGYLQEHVSLPFTVTGIEDMGCFGWEEYYTWGPGNKREYRQLKKTRPSYTDTYVLLRFNDELYEDGGILVDVKRTTDKRRFTLPLADLEGTDEHSKNTQLINDYAMWFVNYR